MFHTTITSSNLHGDGTSGPFRRPMRSKPPTAVLREATLEAQLTDGVADEVGRPANQQCTYSELATAVVGVAPVFVLVSPSWRLLQTVFRLLVVVVAQGLMGDECRPNFYL